MQPTNKTDDATQQNEATDDFASGGAAGGSSAGMTPAVHGSGAGGSAPDATGGVMGGAGTVGAVTGGTPGDSSVVGTNPDDYDDLDADEAADLDPDAESGDRSASMGAGPRSGGQGRDGAGATGATPSLGDPAAPTVVNSQGATSESATLNADTD